MMDTVSYFSFQPVIHDWCNNGRGMCYPVCGMVHINNPLLVIEKTIPGNGGSDDYLMSKKGTIVSVFPEYLMITIHLLPYLLKSCPS